MAKINRVEDLPEWFDLENYRGCEAFGPIEWYARLRDRKQVVDMLFNDNYSAMLKVILPSPSGHPVKRYTSRGEPWQDKQAR